jgi:hypothetical protein
MPSRYAEQLDLDPGLCSERCRLLRVIRIKKST